MSYLLRYLKGFYMALGMFTILPLPFYKWEENYVGYMLPCLPFVGGVAGAIWFAAARLLILGKVPDIFAAAVLTAAPFILSGFIHLDGYMDTCDAILSRRPLEDKLRILKDPHTGAFAVIALGIAFLFQFASVYTIIIRTVHLELFILIPVFSRCCSAFSILCLKAVPQSSYANAFTQNTKKQQRIFVIITAVISLFSVWLLSGMYGIIIVLSVVLGFAAALTYAYREIRGISGDLSGFALTFGELTGLVAWVFLQ